MKITNETRIKLDELQQEYNEKCFNLIKTEAENNNPYKHGDIIQDHYQIGKILNSIIRIQVDSRNYEISYRCEKLNEELNPDKSKELIIIYLENVNKKLNEN